MDGLGRFESDLQPEPSDKNESKLSKTFKRFTKKEEDKVIIKFKIIIET